MAELKIQDDNMEEDEKAEEGLEETALVYMLFLIKNKRSLII